MKILCKSCNTYDADFENLLLIFFFTLLLFLTLFVCFLKISVYITQFQIHFYFCGAYLYVSTNAKIFLFLMPNSSKHLLLEVLQNQIKVSIGNSNSLLQQLLFLEISEIKRKGKYFQVLVFTLAPLASVG